MISRQRFNRTKMLYNTLTETLIVFLFILLAISSIHQKIIGKQKKIIENNEFIPAGFIAIDKDDYEIFLDEKDNLEKLFNEKYQKITEEKDDLESEFDEYIKRAQIGIGPPPCYVDKDSNQVLLEIDFIQDTTFLVKVTNIDKDFVLSPKWTIKRDSLYVLKKTDFKELGKLLHESKIINKSDPECDQQNNPRARSSAYCYECVYVFKLVNLKEERTISRFFPWSSKNDIGSELTKTMQMLAQHYFYSTK